MWAIKKRISEKQLIYEKMILKKICQWSLRNKITECKLVDEE